MVEVRGVVTDSQTGNNNVTNLFQSATLLPGDFVLNTGSSYLYEPPSDGKNGYDLYFVLQFAYDPSSSNWTGGRWWRIYSDYYRGNAGYKCRIYRNFYYKIIHVTVPVDDRTNNNLYRISVTGMGDVPGTAQTNQKLFMVYDDCVFGLNDEDMDDTGNAVGDVEASVLRLSSQMISFANFIN